MDEVRVIARVLARAGKVEQLRNPLIGMLTPTRAEQGCRPYESNNNKELFTFKRSGKSKDALDRHTETTHYKQLTQNIRNLLEGPFEANALDCSVSRGSIETNGR